MIFTFIKGTSPSCQQLNICGDIPSFFVEVDIPISVSHVREGQDIPRLVEANLIGSCQCKSKNADGDDDLNLYTA